MKISNAKIIPPKKAPNLVFFLMDISVGLGFFLHNVMYVT